MINSRHPLFCDTPPPVARCEVTLIPKLRVQFAEFLQYSSLKRLGILYQSTCVGLGYGLCWWSYFLEPAHRTPNPIRGYEPARSVTTTRPTNINVVPIVYAFLPRLRGRLTLLRLALSRNPWTFGGGVSHTPYVTHVSIRTSDTSTAPRRYGFISLQNAPLPLTIAREP